MLHYNSQNAILITQNFVSSLFTPKNIQTYKHTHYSTFIISRLRLMTKNWQGNREVTGKQGGDRETGRWQGNREVAGKQGGDRETGKR